MITKVNEQEYKKQIKSLYGDSIEIISQFKGLAFPIIAKDKFGILNISKASLLLRFKPTIKAAKDKTSYFMEMLKNCHYEIFKEVKPESEYVAAKKKMLFKTKYGIVSVTPDSLLSGHMPTIRSAINKKEYMYNQLRILYNYKYDFNIISTNRHSGKCELICPIHGKVLVDNDYVFSGVGCLKCNSNAQKSDILYLIRLYNNEESFYKLGISYIMKNKKLQRFRQYKKMGYNIEEIKIIKFDDFEKCRNTETKLKHLIKNNLYMPKKWPNSISTETFTEELLNTVINNLYMI